MFVDVKCFHHQCHLGVKNGCGFIDKALAANGIQWKYFSSIAKVSNVWRANMRPIFRVWKTVLGDASALKNAKRAVGRCLSGRW